VSTPGGCILCEATSAGPVLDAAPLRWDFLGSSQPCRQRLRGTYQPPDSHDTRPLASRRPPATPVFAPCYGLCWLVISGALQSPRSLLPPQRELKLLASLWLVGARPMAPVAFGALVQPQLGREGVLALKPNRVLVSAPVPH